MVEVCGSDKWGGLLFEDLASEPERVFAIGCESHFDNIRVGRQIPLKEEILV